MDALGMDESGLRTRAQTRYPSGISKTMPDIITGFPMAWGPIRARPMMRITFGNATVKRLEYEREVAERLNHLRSDFSVVSFRPGFMRVSDGYPMKLYINQ